MPYALEEEGAKVASPSSFLEENRGQYSEPGTTFAAADSARGGSGDDGGGEFACGAPPPQHVDRWPGVGSDTAHAT